MLHSLLWSLGQALARVAPRTVARSFVTAIGRRDPQEILEAFGPTLNRGCDLDNMPLDLAATDGLEFEHLAGLFSSTAFDHGVIAMPIRQAAYVFGLIRQLRARRVIEIGRYKGGSTLLMAAAMRGQGELWSIDIGEKESRLSTGRRPYDQQIAAACARAGLAPRLLTGDSRTIHADIGDVDVVLIDGDHSYEGAKSDFERFGRRVRVGGAVLFDDAVPDERFKTHSDTVGRVVDEAVSDSAFRLVKTVNRLAHLERVAADRS